MLLVNTTKVMLETASTAGTESMANTRSADSMATRASTSGVMNVLPPRRMTKRRPS